MVGTIKLPNGVVSTHSRLKAAGHNMSLNDWKEDGFNTQPPEGGWISETPWEFWETRVSTHSRLKAAGLSSALFSF